MYKNFILFSLILVAFPNYAYSMNQDPKRLDPSLSQFFTKYEEVKRFPNDDSCRYQPDYSLKHIPNYLLGSWNNDNPECQGWLQAHLQACGEEDAKVAKFLLSNLKFYTVESLFENLHVQINASLESDPIQDNESIVIIIDKGKSSEWIEKELIRDPYQRLVFN